MVGLLILAALQALTVAAENMQAAATTMQAPGGPAPPSRKRISFEHDPVTRSLTTAEIEEVNQ